MGTKRQEAESRHLRAAVPLQPQSHASGSPGPLPLAGDRGHESQEPARGCPCATNDRAGKVVIRLCRELQLNEPESPALPRTAQRRAAVLQKTALSPAASFLAQSGPKFSRQIVNASAVSWQWGVSPERRSGFVPHRLLGLSALQRLPTLDEPQPKRPVAGIARSGSKPAAFIGTPPKLFYTHFYLPADRASPSRVGSLISGRKLKNCIQSLGTDLLNFSRGFAISPPPPGRHGKSAHQG